MTQAEDHEASGGVPAQIGTAFGALDRTAAPWTLLRGEADIARDGGDLELVRRRVEAAIWAACAERSRG